MLVAQLKCGKWRIDFENIGEGMSGDFNPEDINDVNYLRFTVYEADCDDLIDSTSVWEGDWREPYFDSSFCTQMPAGVERGIICKALARILEVLLETEKADKSMKRAMEQLSWMDPGWFITL